MIEIIFIIFLAGKIGQIVEAKGYKSGWYKFMFVAAWFGGEIAGAILGGFFIAATNASQCLAYFFALAGAGVGAGISFAIANGLSENPDRPAAVTPPPLVSLVSSELAPAPTASLAGAAMMPVDVSVSLQQAEKNARAGQLEQAAGWFEQALIQQPNLGPAVAGAFAENDAPPWNSATGYALLTLLAGHERKDLAVRYFTRMLDLNPGQAGVALRAAHRAGIDKEAQLIARARGLPWQWWLT